MANRVTRPSNANAHPGMVDRNPPRHSREEIQAEKKAKAAAKAQAAVEKTANINMVAAIERAEKVRATEMDREGNDPDGPAIMPARRTRKRPVNVFEGPMETPTKKRKGDAASGAVITLDESHDALAEAKLAALLNESGTSESEYEEEQPELEDETHSEGAEEELEDDEPDTTIRIKKGGKKQKKGLIAREQISAAVAAMSDDPSLSVTARGTQGSNQSSCALGRVGTSQTPGPQAQRSQTNRGPSGLRPNWQNARAIQSPTVFRAPRENQAGIDSDSDANQPNRSTQVPSRGVTTEPDDIPVYNYGGFVSENSGLERYDHEGEQNSSESLKYKSITKIKEIYSAPPPRHVANSVKMKRKYISFDDLPAGTKERFKKKVIPLSLDTTGALKPWVIPDDQTILDIWNLAFIGSEHQFGGGDVESERFVVVKTLIKRAISTWLHKFADSAEKALLLEFAQQKLDTQLNRSKFVRFLLGNFVDMSDKKRPFIWETVYDDRSARQEGIFQGRLVGRTFMEHLLVVNSIDEAERVHQRPIGALILAVQAVHRALLYSTSGTFELPSEKKSAEFSKTNWGDYTLVTPHGERVVKRASVFLRTINNLKKEQWEDIFKVALAFHSARKQTDTPAKNEEPLSETESEDDLVDPRYDNVLTTQEQYVDI